MLSVALDANALQLAQLGVLAAHALECVEEFSFLRIGRKAQLIDGVVDATSLGLFTGRGAERTLAEQLEQREESERANQSATFGGGPIWMRSPM